MMWSYGSGMNGWAFALMSVSVVLFWALAILGVVALVRFLTRSDRSAAPRPSAEQLLAERFAKGEVDGQDYQRRLATLSGRSAPVDSR